MFDPKAATIDRVLSHDRQLACCRFSADRSLLFAAGYDGRLYRWKLDGEKPDAFPAHRGWVENMALSPDGQRLYTADSWGQVHCWSATAEPMKPLWTIDRAHTTWLRRMSISPDGSLIVTGGNDRVARVFSSKDGKLIHELKDHAAHVMSVAFHPAMDGIATGDLLGTVRHWNLRTGKLLRAATVPKLFKKFHQYDQGGVRVLAFDPAGKTLYCGGFEGTNANQAQGVPTVVPVEWASGQALPAMTPQAEFKGPVVDLAYHPAGYVLAAGSSEQGGALWFWKAGDARDSHFVKHRHSFRGLALHGDGQHLAVAAFGDDGGQRGGNGRRLNAQGEYPDFGGSLVLVQLGPRK